VVGEGDAEALAVAVRDAGLLGDVGERPVPGVVEQQVGHALIVVRMAVGAVTGLLLAAAAVGGERPGHVARDEQVEQAVVVVVEEAGAGAPAAAANARPLRHVRKGAVAVVAIQRVAAIARQVQVGVTVVVVVGGGDAHAVGGLIAAGQAGRLGDV